MNKTQSSKVALSKEKQSTGSKLGDQLRASTNSLSDEERQRLRSVGMALIYGSANGGAKVTASCR